MRQGRKYQNINVLMLVKVMGWLVMIESVFMCGPLAVCLIYGENDWKAFAATAALTLACGWLMSYMTRPGDKRMARREGYLLTATVWVVFSLFGMLPLIFCDHPYTVCEAFTEAMSGLTTTGATIIDDVENLGHGIQIWRAILQWTGGMGIILFTLAVIPMLNSSGGMQMFNAEVTGITHGKLRPRISETAKSLWGIYLLLTLMCMLLLWAGPMTLFESVTYALSTVATGGFSIHNNGVEHFDSNYIKIVTTLFMFLGSVNFALIFYAMTGRFSAIRSETPLRVFSQCVLVFTLLTVVSRWLHSGIGNPVQCVIDSLFMTVSAISSTSYTLTGLESWGQLATGLIIILVAMGGCAGSTSGGVKVDRVMVMVKYMRNEISHALHPNSITHIKIGTRTLRYELVDKVIAFMLLYAGTAVVSALALSAGGLDYGEALFTSLSSISNSGTSMPIGQYGGSLAPLAGWSKVLLAFVMLIGRLEIYTVMVLFAPTFWRK